MRKPPLTAADLIQILELARQGYGHRAIGRKLGVHYHTVRNHIKKLEDV